MREHTGEDEPMNRDYRTACEFADQARESARRAREAGNIDEAVQFDTEAKFWDARADEYADEEWSNGDHTKTYYESAAGMTISAKRAEREIRAHGCSIEEFYAECGVRESYSAQAVLDWLGY